MAAGDVVLDNDRDSPGPAAVRVVALPAETLRRVGVALLELLLFVVIPGGSLLLLLLPVMERLARDVLFERLAFELLLPLPAAPAALLAGDLLSQDNGIVWLSEATVSGVVVDKS